MMRVLYHGRIGYERSDCRICPEGEPGNDNSTDRSDTQARGRTPRRMGHRCGYAQQDSGHSGSNYEGLGDGRDDGDGIDFAGLVPPLATPTPWTGVV